MAKELLLCAPLELQAAASTPGKSRKLRIVGYDGGPMLISGWGEVIVSLKGLEMPESIPIVDSHKNDLDSLIATGFPSIDGSPKLPALFVVSILSGRSEPPSVDAIDYFWPDCGLRRAFGSSWPNSHRLCSMQQRGLRPFR